MRLKAEGRRFDPAPDHQFAGLSADFGQLWGANRQAVTTWSPIHEAARDGSRGRVMSRGVALGGSGAFQRSLAHVGSLACPVTPIDAGSGLR
jgi:hypothetical protein